MKKLVIYFTIYLFVMVLVIDHGFDGIMKIVFKEEIIENNIYTVSAPLEVMRDTLNKMDLDEIKGYIQEISQKHNNYPITIVPISRVSKYERPLLTEVGIVTNVDGNEYKLLIENTDYVLQFKLKENAPSAYMKFASYLLFILMLLIINTIMVYYIWVYLKKLGRGAEQFGEGNFSYRIKTGRLSFISEMAGIFNNMAQRIENLLNSSRELTSAAAHELRTPIARMRFELENLRKCDTAEGSVNGLEEDIKELEDLITQMLTYSRLDRQEDFLNKEEVNAGVHFREYFEGVKVVGEVTFSYSIDEKCDSVYLYIDKKIMNLAVSNLIENGFRYCRSSVEAQVLCSSSNIIVRIKDDGAGIAESVINDIFKPFKRADSSRTRDTGGFGLGLAIVEKAAQMHSGSVSAENIKGNGACFTVRLRID